MTFSATGTKPVIPLKIVRLNRWTIIAGVVLGLLTQAPIVTTVLFLIVGAAALFGFRASLIYTIGTLAFPVRAAEEGEDPGLMRFNNSLAAAMLGLAQIAFLFHANVLGWVLCTAVALAAAAALAGYCIGCRLYFQFKMNRYQFFGR